MKKSSFEKCIALIILLLLGLSLCACEEQASVKENLLLNGDFSQTDGSGMPEDWYTSQWFQEDGVSLYSVSLEDGTPVAKIENVSKNDARFAQNVKTEEETVYLLHGFIRANCEGGRGANLSIEGVYQFSESVYMTGDEWKEVSYYGRTGPGQDRITVFVRLGGYSGESTGTAEFRDISLSKVTDVPAGETIDQWYYDDEEAQIDNFALNGALKLLAAVIIYILAADIMFAICRKNSTDPEIRLLDGKTEAKRDRSPVYWTVFALIMLFIGLLLRFVVADQIFGYDVDIGCFTAWANSVKELGTKRFYGDGGFCDYPPAYILVLRAVSLLGNATAFTVKLPSILTDTLIALMLYIAGSRYADRKTAILASVLWYMNPVTILTGCAWGQCDSVMTCVLLLAVILLMDHKWAAALPVYTFAVLLKPQALMFGPLGVAALVLDLVNCSGKDKKKTGVEKHGTDLKKRIISVVVGVVISAVVLFGIRWLFTPDNEMAAADTGSAETAELPETGAENDETAVAEEDTDWLISMYSNTMTQYDFASVNACNIYYMAGLNWVGCESRLSAVVPVFCFILFAVPMILCALKANKRFRTGLAVAGGAAIVVYCVFAVLAANSSISLSAFGTSSVIISVLFSAFLLISSGRTESVPFIASVMLMLIFNTSTMMHERYLFPAIALLVAAYMLEKDRRMLWILLIVTAGSVLNIGSALSRNMRIGGFDGHLNAPFYSIDSDMKIAEYISAVCNYAACLLAVWTGIDLYCGKHRSSAKQLNTDRKEKVSAAAERLLKTPEKKTGRMYRKDVIAVCAITLLYAVAALVNLGSLKAPQTYWISEYNSADIVFELDGSRDFSVLYYPGIQWGETYRGERNDFELYVSEDGESWQYAETAYASDGDCFAWKYAGMPGGYTGRFLMLKPQHDDGLWLNEIICRDADTNENIPISIVIGPENAQNLIDEQDTLTGEPSWKNSMYFDEIYHARTAYEHLNGLQTYETSHPPLGKVLMSLGIAIFGMCPFGWRFMGTMCGVMMLPAIYMMARLITEKRKYAVAACFIFACDLMHFTQTRIATIDSYVVLFILWSIYFMWYWMKQDFFAVGTFKTLVPLFFSGLFMGLSVASKWTGCYNGIGLAVFFFASAGYRVYQVHIARKLVKTENEGNAVIPSERRNIIVSCAEHGMSKIILNVLSCLIFFIVIPMVIYYVSYIPYFRYSGGVTVQKVIEAAVGDYFETGHIDAFNGMLGYHSQPGLGMDHPYYSPWYEWPFIAKPMWYYSDSNGADNTASTIMALGNPAVWWGGIAALCCVIGMCWVSIRCSIMRVKQDILCETECPRAGFWLAAAFLAQYGPWMLVPRGTYIYHYFASVPITILCIVYVLSMLERRSEREGSSICSLRLPGGRYSIRPVTAVLIIFCLITLILFIAFFPYASGITVNTGWLESMRWFDNWLWY